MKAEEEKEDIEEYADDSVCADARVLHDVKDALAVVAPTSKSVEEVAEPVLMQRSGGKETGRDGDQDGDGIGQYETCTIECGCHNGCSEPSCERPVFHHTLITGAVGLAYPPEGQSGEEDECGKRCLPPFGLVDGYSHDVDVVY